MRKAFSEIVYKLIENDIRTTVILGDIGVHSLRDTFKDFPNNIYNLGILEQAMIGVSAGMSSRGLIPIIHTIAPFMVERAFEQIKIDFGYQRLQGNLVSVGASYDYAALGCTHHCPGDVGVLRNIPEIEIYTPGNAMEFKKQICQNYNNNKLSYFRLSEEEHGLEIELTELGAGLVKQGFEANVLSVGPIVESVSMALKNRDANIIYTSSLNPIDLSFIKKCLKAPNLMLVSNLYIGSVAPFVLPLLEEGAFRIKEIGTPTKFLTNYGSMQLHNEGNGLDANGILRSYDNFVSGIYADS
jgi:transketolase